MKRLAMLCCAVLLSGPVMGADLSDGGGDAILRALEDEDHAEAVHAATLTAFGDVRPFADIIGAERKHPAALPGPPEPAAFLTRPTAV